MRPTNGRPGYRLVRHDSALGAWELAVRRPGSELATYVAELQGYVETRAPRPVKRREVPWPGVVLIVNFGPPFRIADPRAGPPADHGSFVAGLHDSYVVTESLGLSRCIQVNLNPLGAYRLLDLPLHAIANRTIPLEDLLGAAASRLADRLDAAGGWTARFELIERALASRLAAAREPSPGIVWAWRRLEGATAPLHVGALAQELAWSHKRLIAEFREQIGMPPKTVARVLRFHRVIRWLAESEEARWAELAHRAGYFDQAHFNRDFRELAGSTPGEFLRRRVPDGGVMEG
jgi:AraC-like DNA-binding protein